MNPLEQRLDALEKLVSTMCDLNDSEHRNELMDDAKVMAIYSMVGDLAEKAGVSTDDFLKHYKIRFHWWHDYYLRQTEDVSPALAAELDPRTVEQADVSPTYPFLFDEPRQD